MKNKTQLLQEKYAILLRTIPDIVFEVDSKGRFTFLSEAIKQLGYLPDQLIGKSFKSIIHPDDFKLISRASVLAKYKGQTTGPAAAPKLFDERRTGLRATTNLRARLILKAAKEKKGLNSYCYVEVTSSGHWDKPVNSRDKKLLGSIGVIRDITERREAEQALKDSEAKYRDLAENANDLIQSVALDGTLVYVNPAWRQALGYNQAEAARLKLFDIIHPESIKHCQKIFQRIVSGENVTNIEAKFLTKKGRAIDVEGNANCRYVNGKPAATQAIFRDVTARQVAQAELKRARADLETQAWGLQKTNEAVKLLYKELEEKNKRLQALDRLKSDFISTVSHELRTPLSITKEGISLVLDQIPGKINVKQNRILTTAINNIDRLARIINDLLDISKIESGKMALKRELININSLIKQIAYSFSAQIKQKDLEIKVDLPAANIEVYIDEDRINQVLTNLVSNAFKFTKQGHIKISVTERADEIECSVEDTGSGISKENLSRVFDKFQQFGRVTGGGYKGTGLGLSIAKGIVEMHLGRIWLDSELGQGTTFGFTLPKHTPESLLREYLGAGIKEAEEKNAEFSIETACFAEPDKLKQEFSDSEIQSIVKELKIVFQGSLRREGDVALKINEKLIVLFNACDRENIIRVESRLKQAVQGYLEQHNLSGKVKLEFTHLTYPDEVKSVEQIFDRVKQQ
ncbi:PAS domain S-box protein [Candidatus Omnitrophota bacterium]